MLLEKLKDQFSFLNLKIYKSMQIFFKKKRVLLHVTAQQSNSCCRNKYLFFLTYISGWQEIKVHVKLQQILNRLVCTLQSQLLNLLGPSEFIFVRRKVPLFKITHARYYVNANR